MSYRLDFEYEAPGDEFELDLSEELYDEGELELFDTETYEPELGKRNKPPIKSGQPLFPLLRAKPGIARIRSGQSITGLQDILPAWALPKPESFSLIPFEAPGGSLIWKKTQLMPSDIDLVTGIGGNNHTLHKEAAAAWRALIKEARSQKIAEPLLHIVSGLRTSKAQVDVKTNKSGQVVDYNMNHQTGRAVDIHLGGETSTANVAKLRTLPAYRWLVAVADRFGFYHDPATPWHWEYNPKYVGWVDKIHTYKVEKREITRKGGQAYHPSSRTGIGVLHTTEGSNISGAFAKLQLTRNAPHFIVGEGKIVQCRPLSAQSASLQENGHDTNAQAQVQIEMVGVTNKVELWPPDDEPLKPVVAVMAYCAKVLGIPLKVPNNWPDNTEKSMPKIDHVWASPNNPRRKEALEKGLWPSEKGWWIHLEVPFNDHYDGAMLRRTDMIKMAKELLKKL